MAEEKKPTRRGFLKWGVRAAGGLAALAGVRTYNEHNEVVNQTGDPIISADYPTLKEGKDENTPPTPDWIKAPRQEVLEGGNERNIFVLSTGQDQTIKPGENRNDIFIMNENFGKKTIEKVDMIDNAIAAPYNTLILDYKMLAAFDHVIVQENKDNPADIELKFIKEKNGVPNSKTPTIILKDQLPLNRKLPLLDKVGNPTISEIAIAKPDGNIIKPDNGYRANSVIGLRNILSRAIYDAKNMMRQEPNRRLQMANQPKTEEDDPNKPINFENLTEEFNKKLADIQKRIAESKMPKPEEQATGAPQAEDPLQKELKETISLYRKGLHALIKEHNQHIEDVVGLSYQRLSGVGQSADRG